MAKLSRKLYKQQTLIYKTVLKSICIYGIQLWGMSSTSNIEILKLFHSKALLIIVDAPWYVPNTVIQKHLQTPTVKEEIRSVIVIFVVVVFKV
jgi:hypothetical protein